MTLPNDILRMLPEDLLKTLSDATRAEIQKRLGRS